MNSLILSFLFFRLVLILNVEILEWERGSIEWLIK